jgi:Tfp pilus assembly protein PilV
MSKRGFSLLESLIATGVLIIVVLAVISLSNSLIAGTVANADRTIINRWAAEGVELTQKIRDDNILAKNSDPATGLPSWFNQAIKDNGRDYGWFKLEVATANSWKLSPAISSGNRLSAAEFKQAAENLTSDQTLGYRLICVEALAATAVSADDNLQCNSDEDGQLVDDGARTELTDCQTSDVYCALSQVSVNANQLNSDTIIPPGNALKIRSVVLWENKANVRSASMAMLLTNWRGYGQ